LTWAHLADLIEAFGAVALWRPAYRASLIKLARIPVVLKPGDTGAFGRFKKGLYAGVQKMTVSRAALTLDMEHSQIATVRQGMMMDRHERNPQKSAEASADRSEVR
jgi:hypothetical protein